MDAYSTVGIEIITDAPIVSIIMPLYNKRNYVRRAIDSIQKQTIKNWELIIIDDGSNDGSLEEVPTSDNRIRIYQQENAGPAAARNHGIQKAKGRLVTFIDADDYYYTNKLEQEITLLGENDDVDWMISARDYKIKNEVKVRGIDDINGKPIPKHSEIIKDALRQLNPSQWHINGICIKSDLLARMKGFRENMRCYEVTDFFYRCAVIQPTIIVCTLPLHCQVDVPMSTFKEPYHRIEGLRLLSENLFKLSQEYPAYSSRLLKMSRDIKLTYCGRLILFGSKTESRQYLMEHFTGKKNLRWWKMLITSWLPDVIVTRILVPRYPFRQN